jgi:hypothetical protein
MNKRGTEGVLMSNVIYLILFLIAIIPVGVFAYGQKDGAANWEDIYAKEIARVINEVVLDVTIAAGIAFDRGIEINEIFNFDNVDNRVSVSLRSNAGTSFGFFNDVDVVEWKVENTGTHTELSFMIVEVQKAT